MHRIEVKTYEPTDLYFKFVNFLDNQIDFEKIWNLILLLIFENKMEYL